MTSQRDNDPSIPPHFPSVGGVAFSEQTTPTPTVAPVQAEPSPSRVTSTSPNNRGRWAVAAIATIVVIAIVGGLVVMLGARSATPSLVAQYAPADAAAYVEVRYDLPGDQADKLAEFMSHFPGFADQAAFQQKIDETLANALEQSGTGLDWATDIEPWFGGQIGFFTSSLAPTMGTPPSFTAVFSVTDKQTLDEVISRHVTGDADVHQEDYNGQTLWSGEELTDGHRVSFAATDEAFIVSTRIEDLKDALDIKAGTTKGLADDEFFLAQLAAMQADRLGLIYFDSGSVLESLPAGGVEMGGVGLPLPEGCMDAFQSAAGIRAMGEIRAESDHLAFRMRSEFQSGADLPPAPANRDSGLTSVMPGSTAAYLEMRQAGANIGFLIGQLLDCIPAGSDGMGFDPAQIEQILGVPLDEYFDFLQDAGIAVTLNGDKLGAGLVATVDDEAVANSRVATLLSFLRLAGGTGENGIKVEEQQHGTARVTVITIPASEVLGEPASAPVSIAVSVHSGRLYLGLDDFVTKALEQQSTDSLAAQPHLQAAVNEVGAANIGTVFVDFDDIWSFVEAQMPAETRTDYETEGKPFIEPLSDFVVVSRNDNGINDGHGFLYVE